jgi:hypothetical protein
VIWDVRVHRADDADVVDTASDLWKNLAHFDSGTAHSVECERGAHERAGLAFRFFVGQLRLITVMLGEFGFGIERVDLRGAAIHEKMNQAFCAGPEMRLPWGKGSGGSTCGLLPEQSAKSEQSGSRADTGKQLTTGEWDIHGRKVNQ